MTSKSERKYNRSRRGGRRTERLGERGLAVASGAVAHRVVRVAAAAVAGRRARLLEQLRLREDAALEHLRARALALQVPHLQPRVHVRQREALLCTRTFQHTSTYTYYVL